GRAGVLGAASWRAVACDELAAHLGRRHGDAQIPPPHGLAERPRGRAAGRAARGKPLSAAPRRRRAAAGRGVTGRPRGGATRRVLTRIAACVEEGRFWLHAVTESAENLCGEN